MASEGSSFAKGMLFGSLVCLVFSIFAGLRNDSSSGKGNHFHHHVKAASKEELMRMPESMKQQLSQQVRVYCLIMVQPKVLVHWAATRDTWSKHCDKAMFYTSEASKALEAVDLQEKNEWAQIRKALQDAFRNASNLHWFFIARATTFAIIENLKYLLLGKDPNEPFYIGNVLKSGDLDYVEYNSGVVLSYEAVRRLMEAFKDEYKCPQNGNALWNLKEEKELAVCLRFCGVYAENGEDSEGNGLFNSKSVYDLISEGMKERSSNVVKSCCSDLAITFSGMSPSEMQVMMFGVYRLRPYGHSFQDSLVFLPPKGSDND
ncbi:C1GALT1-specific chaperone 1-like [Scleropages formosus]|uniref:C1GALT1-specific chaperone 1 n=1 Tax=Scleropages formosus TaxID=113540 RepID=A0A0N8JXF8_SCLFO|nr:C1GALT1-specific chaperone 1-like [Scleropages formosus]KPP63617.1 C1GALT1-specific chaperone 1-like [Scleropages formosus]